MISKGKIALLHVAKRQLGLDEESYRDILRRVGGVDSASKLDAWSFNRVMEHLHGLGFVSDFALANIGHRKGMATPTQIAKIKELWGEFTNGSGTDLTLGKWLSHTFGVSALRFIDDRNARKVIGALVNMTRRKAG